jgi:hypothetical protein
MKKYISASKKNIFLLIIAVSFIHLSASAQKVHFQESTVVPAAKGMVKVSTNKNKGFDVDVDVYHLAGPGRLQPAAKTYIVWMDTERNGTKNLGEMQSKDKFLSNTLKADLKITTPFRPTRIFITAEDVAAISNPAGQQVLTTPTFN